MTCAELRRRRVTLLAAGAHALADVGDECFREERKWRNKGGLQAFLQVFPNLRLFCARISKESFGGFVGFQGVTRVANPKELFPNFFVAVASFRPHSRRRRAGFRL